MTRQAVVSLLVCASLRQAVTTEQLGCAYIDDPQEGAAAR